MWCVLNEEVMTTEPNQYHCACCQAAAVQVARARAEERESLRIARDALTRIAKGEESVPGLRPEYYGHATKIAMDAIADVAAAALRART